MSRTNEREGFCFYLSATISRAENRQEVVGGLPPRLQAWGKVASGMEWEANCPFGVR